MIRENRLQRFGSPELRESHREFNDVHKCQGHYYPVFVALICANERLREVNIKNLEWAAMTWGIQ